MRKLLTKFTTIFIISLLMIYFHQTLITTRQFYTLMQTAVYKTQNIPPVLFWRKEIQIDLWVDNYLKERKSHVKENYI